MKKIIKKCLISLALSAQIAPVFAGSNDYKPAHGGYSGMVPQPTPLARPTKFTNMPRDVMLKISDYLDSASSKQIACTNQQTASDIRFHREIIERPRIIAESERLASEQTRLQGTSITPLSRFDASVRTKVTPEFAKVGPMYEVAGVIWSGVAPRTMNQKDAVAYCTGLGGGSRLPTKDEYIALSRTMGSSQPDPYWRAYEGGNIHPDDPDLPAYELESFEPGDLDVAGYRRDLIPNITGRWYWSASTQPIHDRATVFRGNSGSVSYEELGNIGGSVRCIVGG